MEELLGAEVWKIRGFRHPYFIDQKRQPVICTECYRQPQHLSAEHAQERGAPASDRSNMK